MILLSARGSAELKRVASDSATQGLWLENRKVGFKIGVVDRSRPPGRGTVRKVRRGGRREYTDLGLDLDEREEQVVCHASPLVLAMTDDEGVSSIE